MQECNNEKWLANFVFEIINWQSPSTFVDELKNEPEILGMENYIKAFYEWNEIKIDKLIELDVPAYYNGKEYNYVGFCDEFTYKKIFTDKYLTHKIEAWLIYITKYFENETWVDKVEINQDINYNDGNLIIEVEAYDGDEVLTERELILF
jgi:hypothetical protein